MKNVHSLAPCSTMIVATLQTESLSNVPAWKFQENFVAKFQFALVHLA